MGQSGLRVAAVSQGKIPGKPFKIGKVRPGRQAVLRRKPIGTIGSPRPHLGPCQIAPPTSPALGLAEVRRLARQHHIDRVGVPSFAGAPLHPLKGEARIFRQRRWHGVDQRVDTVRTGAERQSRLRQRPLSRADAGIHAFCAQARVPPDQHVQPVLVMRRERFAVTRENGPFVCRRHDLGQPGADGLGLGIRGPVQRTICLDQRDLASTGLGRFTGEERQDVAGTRRNGNRFLALAAQKTKPRPVRPSLHKPDCGIEIAKTRAQPVPFDDVARDRAGAFAKNQRISPVPLPHFVKRAVEKPDLARGLAISQPDGKTQKQDTREGSDHGGRSVYHSPLSG